MVPLESPSFYLFTACTGTRSRGRLNTNAHSKQYIVLKHYRGASGLGKSVSHMIREAGVSVQQFLGMLNQRTGTFTSTAPAKGEGTSITEALKTLALPSNGPITDLA